MKRKLISQMRNEWRSNVWMSVELIIVGVLLFAIFAAFATFVYVHKPPKGIDFSDIYVGRIGRIGPTATAFKPYTDSVHNYHTDLEMLKASLSSNPFVESVGTGSNAIPYNYNYYGTMINLNDGDTTIAYHANCRRMNPDMVKTLRITGLNGESPDQFASQLEEGKIIISVNEADDTFDAEKWVGHETFFGNDTANIFTIGGVINGIRRVDYEPWASAVILTNVPEQQLPFEIAIRVTPGKSNDFLESLDESFLEFGNVYISDVTSIEKRKESAHRDFTIMMRNLTACAVFLMIAVFLGILGSFWYRTQQRIPEIALRKVNGATNRDILFRFLSEGLLLLLFSAPFIVIIPLITGLEFVLGGEIPSPKWVLWSMLPVALLALALMIIAGIAFPASKAMKTDPAQALKDQ